VRQQGVTIFGYAAFRSCASLRRLFDLAILGPALSLLEQRAMRSPLSFFRVSHRALGPLAYWDKAPSSRLGTTTVITMSGSSQQTSTFGPQTYQVRIATSAQPAFVVIGNNPTATSTNGSIWGTNIVDYVQCTPGQQCAVLQAGTGGTISITECA
jgi:hypothetical protein